LGKASEKVAALFKNQQNGMAARDMGGDLVGVRIMEPTQEAIDVMARGMCGTADFAGCPVMDWTYNGDRSDQQDHFKPLPEEPNADRQAWFKWMIDFTIRFGTSRGGVYGIVDKKTNKLCAASICCPPKCVGIGESEEEMGMNMHEAGEEMGAQIFEN
jgi:hypothetical protein